MAASRIFRKVALERLSSPEQLDQPMEITGGREWFALTGVLLLIGAGLVWAFTGKVASTAKGDGVIIRRGGIVNVVAAGTGLLVDVQVKPGDHVKAGQSIGRVAQPSLLERIRVTEAAMDEARGARERNLRVRSTGSKLQVEALDRQRANAQREIETLQQQTRVTNEQIRVDEQLFAKGFITRQQMLVPQDKLVQIEGQIATQRALLKQLDAQQYTAEQQPQDSDIDYRARYTELERNLAGLRQEYASSTEVVSPAEGQVLEVKLNRGAPVAPGTPVISMQSDAETIEALLYVPAAIAKDLRPGMDAQVSPGTIKREEYGYMLGRISFVADYPASPAAMMRNLENESLTQSLAAAGPVIEVRVTLDAGATPSGFRWSSRQGPPVRITSGTLCVAVVVTHYDRPVDLFLPAVLSYWSRNRN